MLRASKGRLLTVALIALIAGCWGACQWLASANQEAKDHRDLHDLTRSLPWEASELLVPDAATREDDALGYASSHEFSVSYRVGPGGRGGPVIKYAIHQLTEDNSLEDIFGCGARKVRTCTSLGSDLTKVVTHDTDNSDPSLGLYRHLGNRVISVTGYGGDADVDQLLHVLDHTHRPTDAELLRLLRPPGYQTDWS